MPIVQRAARREGHLGSNPLKFAGHALEQFGESPQIAATELVREPGRVDAEYVVVESDQAERNRGVEGIKDPTGLELRAAHDDAVKNFAHVTCPPARELAVVCTKHSAFFGATLFEDHLDYLLTQDTNERILNLPALNARRRRCQ
jgi:hypothetical protein